MHLGFSQWLQLYPIKVFIQLMHRQIKGGFSHDLVYPRPGPLARFFIQIEHSRKEQRWDHKQQNKDKEEPLFISFLECLEIL